MSYDDHYARWSYEQLILQQPHVRFEGLWRIDRHHFVHCPDVETATTRDGESLRAWFNQSCRTVTAWVDIVAEVPAGAQRVPDRTAEHRAILFGSPRNRRQAFVDMSLELPATFPQFTLDNPGADVVLVTRGPLTPEDRESAISAYASLGDYPPLQFKTDPARDIDNEAFRYSFGDGDIELIPSRRLVTKCGRDLRFAVEEDEDCWRTARDEVLARPAVDVEAVLPKGWERDPARLSCLVDATVFPADNIRTYLSLYDTVYLTLPLGDRFESSCTSLGVSPDGFRKLIELRRVRLLLPQSLDRYPLRWLSELAEVAADGIMLSRRLALATIIDSRRRIPILYPPLGPRERHDLLHTITTQAEKIVGPRNADRFTAFIAELGSAWSQFEWSVNARGAMGTSHLGVGLLAGTLFQQITGRDVRLEAWAAAQKVEWAGALGAHVFSSTVETYDDSPMCDFLASLYSPAGMRRLDVNSNTMLSCVSDLLTIDSTVSVVDFARDFASADIRRLRDVVMRLTRENVDPDYLRNAIAGFNAEVTRYERRPDLLKTLNVVGLMSATAVAAGVVPQEVQTAVPLAGLILGFILQRLIDELPRLSTTAGATIDLANAALAGRLDSEAVLVSRARKEVARHKRK